MDNRPGIAGVLRAFAALGGLSLLASCGEAGSVRSFLRLESHTALANGMSVTSSSQQSPFVKAENLFNDATGWPWLSRRLPFFPEWIEFTYPKPKAVGEFGYASLPGRPNSAPREFQLQIWENGRWRNVLVVADGCVTPENTTRSWRFDKEFTATRFRLLIKSSCGDNEHVALQNIIVERYRQLARLGELKPGAQGPIYPGNRWRAEVGNSSAINPATTAKNLFDGNRGSVWHREIEKLQTEKTSWVSVDFGARPPPPVTALRINPHPGQPGQFFNNAYFQGRQDDSEWSDIAQLKLDAAPKSGDPIVWSFANPVAFRQYRLLIPSGFTDGIFYSMAEIQFLGAGVAPPSRPKPPAVARLGALPAEAYRRVFPAKERRGAVRASSSLNAANGPKNLFDGVALSVWHREVKNLRREPTSWVAVDLGAAAIAPVSALRLSPNAGQPGQFFDRADFQGRQEGGKWAHIARLGLKAAPKDGRPIAWRFDNAIAYRHYRLLILSGFAGGDFYSMAEMAMYAAARAKASRPQTAKPSAPIDPLAARLTAPETGPADRVFPRRGVIARLTSNSVLNKTTGVEKLFDGDRKTIWHVDVAKAKQGITPWVRIDLGRRAHRPVRILRVRPRADALVQFLKTALFEGSSDGKVWTPIARIGFDKVPIDGDEIAWRFDNDRSYRFYRLTIPSGYAAGQFLSMAELVLESWPSPAAPVTRRAR